LWIDPGVDIVCEKMDIRGDLNNLGILHVLDKLYMRGRSLKNGSSNDQKGIIEAEEFLFLGDGSKLDNRYGSIKARKTLECDVEEIICGDYIAKTAAPGDPNVLLGLGFIKPYTSWLRHSPETANGYGQYYLSNDSFMASLGKMLLKASRRLFVNYGHVKSRGEMILDSPCIHLLSGSIEGKDDIQITSTYEEPLNLVIERRKLADINQVNWGYEVFYRTLVDQGGRIKKCSRSVYGECRISLESRILSEGNIVLNALKQMQLVGSRIQTKKSFYLDSKKIDLAKDAPKGVLHMAPYVGHYKKNNGCRNSNFTTPIAFSDESNINCSENLIITDKDLDLNFDHGVLEANRIKIQSSSLQSNNSVFINQENPSNGSRNIGEEYIEVKIEEEKKENTKRKLRSDRPDIQGAHKDIPIKVEDSGMEDSEMQQEPLEQMKKKIKTDDKNN
jgi:hypothetical protein